jgi:hypothetical protein
MSTRNTGTFMLSIAALAVGCVAQTEGGAEVGSASEAKLPIASTEQALTYTIELNAGHALKYHAFKDGSLVVAESGNSETDLPAMEQYHLDLGHPRDVFRAVRPTEQVPAEVMQLEELANRMHPATNDEQEIEPLISAQAGETEISKHATSSAAHFTGEHFGCFTNWTGGDAFAQGSARWAIYKFAPFVGLVRPVLYVNNNRVFGDTVNQGEFKWYWARGGLNQTNNAGMKYPSIVAHFLQVTDAAGKQVHWSARMHNLKENTASCAETSTVSPSSDTFGAACVSHYGTIGD